MQKGIGVTMPGKFRGFVEENEMTKQQCSGFSYLKTLGITHIQLMPITDFGSVDENYPLMHYNWGYDPVQYRVPVSYTHLVNTVQREEELRRWYQAWLEAPLTRCIPAVSYTHQMRIRDSLNPIHAPCVFH